jgi:hypothetical protein
MKNHLLLRLSNMVVFCKPKTIIVDGVDNAVFFAKEGPEPGLQKIQIPEQSDGKTFPLKVFPVT